MSTKTYTLEEVEKAIRSAFEAQGVKGVGEDLFVDTVFEHLERKTETFTHCGWVIERVDGKDIPGLKGRQKKNRGFKLTKDSFVKYVYPENSEDAKEFHAKQKAELLDRAIKSGVNLEDFG